MKKLLALASTLLSLCCGPAAAEWGGIFTNSSSGGSGTGGVTVGAAISGSCTSGYVLYSNAGVIGCLQLTSVTGTPAVGDLLYFDSATSQALLTAASGSVGAYLRSAGTGAAPIWSTLILPNASTSGGVLYSSAANTVTSSGALAANALVIGGGAGAAPSTTTTGTGILTALGVNVGSAGAPVLFNGAGGTPSSLTLTNATGLPVAGGGTGGTSVQTATQALSTPRIIYKQSLPMVYMSSGTMTGSPNGNGAFTGLTALTGVQPKRALCYMPANSVATSSAAGWYFCTFDTTQTGNIIDTTPYTPSSTPPVWPSSPTTPTTASTWTGATGAITAITFSVPANALGANGALEFGTMQLQQTNNANAKSITYAFGALASAALSAASAGSSLAASKVTNQGTANNIIISAIGSNLSTGAIVNGTVDTTSAVTVTITANKATATDNLGIMSFIATILSDGT